MRDDEDLRALFRDFHPVVDDGEAFMASLDRKLRLVEQLRIQNARAARQRRLSLWAALLIGILIGTALMGWIILRPQTWDTVETFFTLESLSFLLISWKGFLLAILAVLLALLPFARRQPEGL